MKNRYYTKTLLTALIATSALFADSPALAMDLKAEDALKVHAKLGYISTQGNTETTTYALEAKVKKGWEKDVLEFEFDGQYSSDKSVETKNKYFIELEYNYIFTEQLAFGYLAGYKDDKFSGFNYQTYTGPGIKYNALKDKAQNLTIDANILYAQDSTEDIHKDSSGDIIAYPNPTNTPTASTEAGTTKSYGSMRLKAIYTLQMLENLKFTQELTYRSDMEDTAQYFVFSKTAFDSKISDMFSAGISYKIDYVNSPVDGKENSDRTLTATIGMDF